MHRSTFRPLFAVTPVGESQGSCSARLAAPSVAFAAAAMSVLRLRACLAGMAAVLALVGCGGSSNVPPVIDIALIGFNDFHGNLEPPKQSIRVADVSGAVALPAGGVAYMASAITALKARTPHHAVVSAGDLVSASPMLSSLFLDEPTVEVMNLMAIDFNAVGNHEFDRGWRELLRLQHGGCEKFTVREPCQISQPFTGARFGFLAANVQREDGKTLLPATGTKRFTQDGASVTVGFIGMTLAATPTMVAPAGVAGLRFADEADTANAQAAKLRADGADIVVLALHEGGGTTAGVWETSCAGLSGDIVPILERLDPAIDVVISGHTHRAYVCNYGSLNPQKPFLLTSAGQYGTLLTDIALRFDTDTRRLVHKSARNVVVQNGGYPSGAGTVLPSPLYPAFAADAQVQALLAPYQAAVAPLANRPAGLMGGTATRREAASGESALGNLIADAQLLATRSPGTGGAQLSFMHAGGIRADLAPDEQGLVRYGQLFAVQPFGNNLVVKTYTGAQIRELLEAQFEFPVAPGERTRVLSVSKGFGYRYDLSQPLGARVGAITLNGEALQDQRDYRVAISSFLAGGGSGYRTLAGGRDMLGGDQDMDVLEAYFRHASPVAVPATDRITRVAPK